MSDEPLSEWGERELAIEEAHWDAKTLAEQLDEARSGTEFADIIHNLFSALERLRNLEEEHK